MTSTASLHSLALSAPSGGGGTASAVAGGGPTMISCYDFNGTEEGQLSFVVNTVIYNVKAMEEGWSEGALADGRVGIFPTSYVEEFANI